MPPTFQKGEAIEVHAYNLMSARTHFTYEYYSLKFCLPKNKTVAEAKRDDTAVNTPYLVRMAENSGCKLVCNESDQPLTWDSAKSNRVIKGIQDEYVVYL